MTKGKNKQIAIDINAWKLLNLAKKDLVDEGRNPSHSDAIRLLWKNYEKKKGVPGHIKH